MGKRYPPTLEFQGSRWMLNHEQSPGVCMNCGKEIRHGSRRYVPLNEKQDVKRSARVCVLCATKREGPE